MNQQRHQQYFRTGQRRPSNIGSLINRIYESSGPAGKLRGRAQDLVTTYLYHAREAAARNDGVAMEACLQYAEHYRRIMNGIREESEERHRQAARDI